MKAEELMLFDLIRRKKDGKSMIVVELRYAETIAAIPPDDVYYGDMEDYHESEIDPIPLTPEILEKNTSESNRNMFGGMNYALNANFFIENRGDRFCLSRRMPRHKYSTFWVCDIHYIHELQHALRLCGIKKEIMV